MSTEQTAASSAPTATHGWVATSDESTLDDWSAGPYDTLEQALEHAPNDLGLDGGDRFAVGRRLPYKPMVCARALIDQVGDATYDDVGEAADQFLVGIDDQDLEPLQRTLQIAFDAWLAHRGLEPTFFEVVDVRSCTYSGVDQGAHVDGE